MPTIQVSSIDFNPLTDGPVNADVNQDVFYGNLRDGLPQTKAFMRKGYENYKNNLKTVLDVVRQADFIAPDIPSLTNAIVTAISDAYKERGITFDASVRGDVESTVRDALVSNLPPTVQMEQSEKDAFSKLVNIVGPQGMSRRKGIPTRIDINQLPSSTNSAVSKVLSTIRDYNTAWTGSDVFLARWIASANHPGDLVKNVATQLKANGYQGNHTNEAGWLPQVALPTGANFQPLLQQMFNAVQIQVATKPALQAAMATIDPFGALGLGQQSNPTNKAAFVDEITAYKATAPAQLQGANLATLRQGSWIMLAQNVSAYIEFSVPDRFNRLVFDCANNRVYICIHYNWLNGYNPFFEIINFTAL